jgi:pimeloyl-ACP methyl ester carboxylesterase
MISYRIAGSGPPLLLIHGWGVTHNIWHNLELFLKDDFKLILIELPGMGRSCAARPDGPYYDSCAAAIEDLRRALGIEHWAVLSYSAGTRVAEAYLRREPAHVSRGVFLCPACLSRGRALGLRCLVELDRRWPRLGDWLLSGWRLKSLIVLLGFNGRRHPYAMDWAAEISAQPLAGLKAALGELSSLGRRPFQIRRVSALYVWGRQDRLVTRPRRLRANDRVIPASHSAPLLAAPEVLDAILPFLQ